MCEMPAGQFKARCLKVMDQVARTGEPVVVTKHGKPVVRVVPVEEGALPVFGRLAGSVTRASDLISPIDEPWDAEAE